jgi:hypothetical protein
MEQLESSDLASMPTTEVEEAPLRELSVEEQEETQGGNSRAFDIFAC